LKEKTKKNVKISANSKRLKTMLNSPAASPLIKSPPCRHVALSVLNTPSPSRNGQKNVEEKSFSYETVAQIVLYYITSLFAIFSSNRKPLLSHYSFNGCIDPSEDVCTAGSGSPVKKRHDSDSKSKASSAKDIIRKSLTPFMLEVDELTPQEHLIYSMNPCASVETDPMYFEIKEKFDLLAERIADLEKEVHNRDNIISQLQSQLQNYENSQKEMVDKLEMLGKQIYNFHITALNSKRLSKQVLHKLQLLKKKSQISDIDQLFNSSTLFDQGIRTAEAIRNQCSNVTNVLVSECLEKDKQLFDQRKHSTLAHPIGILCSIFVPIISLIIGSFYFNL
jgi:hypothetical protein